MQLVKRKELNSLIGENGFFKSYPSLHEKLRYFSGIIGFDPLPKHHRQGNVITFIGHSLGIEIRENASGSKVALPYSKIKSWEIKEFKHDRHYLHIHLDEEETLIFNFLLNATDDIFKYFKLLNIEQLKEPRKNVDDQTEITK